jgi:hypothetical protein
MIVVGEARVVDCEHAGVGAQKVKSDGVETSVVDNWMGT